MKSGNGDVGLFVDLFAGAGGASIGIEAGTGGTVDIAINHDKTAIAVHKANHPHTKHLTTDIWEVDPKTATGGQPVAFLWASPDCTHFSVAKGGKPRKQKIRSLAWATVKWARDVRPKVIMLENVAEFRGWGPLDKDGHPIKVRKGETFKRWKRELERLGYVVDYRILDASQFGAPTRRRRLFLIARCDGQPIRWPEITHGPGLKPLHTAAECIDWTLPCRSIFERKKPLAEKTLWRIAQGIRRFVLENPSPFIVRYNGTRGSNGRTESTDAPFSTLDTSNRFGVVVPVIAGVGGRAGQSKATPGNAPIGTVTSKNDRAVIAPHLVKVNHGKRDPRGEQLDLPLTTITAARRGHALVAPTLIQTGYGERPGQRPRYLDLHGPMGTAVAGGVKTALVSAFLSKHFGDPKRKKGGGKVIGSPLTQPAGTVTTRDHQSLAAVTLAKFRGDCHSADVNEPLPTVSAGGKRAGVHVAEVRAFLCAYYGAEKEGQDLRDPMRTLTTKARFGLVTVSGIEYQIVDIGMRMLQPHELLRAQFGRFAEHYSLAAAKTKSAKVRLIGNSVCPEVAEAVVAANLPFGAGRELVRRAA